MFFKHYPGLFIPLEKGTPSVFQLLYQAPDFGNVDWPSTIIVEEKQKKKTTHLKETFVWTSLHQHDKHPVPFFFFLWVVPWTFIYKHSLIQYLPKSYSLNMFCTTTGLALQNAIMWSSSFGLRQTWDAHCELPKKKLLQKRRNSYKRKRTNSSKSH